MKDSTNDSASSQAVGTKGDSGHHMWCPQSLDNKSKKQDAESRINAAIADFYRQHGKLHPEYRIYDLAGCDSRTGKPYLDAFRRKIEREQKRDQYLALYNMKINESGSISYISKDLFTQELIKHQPFSTYFFQKLADSFYILYHLYPSDTYRLTFTIPGDTDESYLVISQHSERIRKSIINKLFQLLPKEHQYCLWCWELQNRGSLHLHVDLPILPWYFDHFAINQLRPLWTSILDEIDEETGIDLYAIGNSYSHRNNKDIIHIDITKASNAYLSKPKSKNPRTIFGTLHASPMRWGGASRSLSTLVPKSIIKEVITVDTLNAAVQIVTDLKLQIQADWKNHYNPYRHRQIGFRTTLQVYQVAAVKQLVHEEAHRLREYYKLTKEQSPFSVVFHLHPNHFFKIRWSISIEYLRQRRDQYRESMKKQKRRRNK